MAAKKIVTMAQEHQLIVLGQIGNIGAGIKKLKGILIAREEYGYLADLGAIENELAILEKYFPPLSKDFPRFDKPKAEDGNS